MSPRVWATSSDGSISYLSLTQDKVEGALNVMRKSFFLHENVCQAVELPQHPEAIQELEELSLRAGRDGTSVIAVENSTGKVAGVAFNKLQLRDNLGGSYFEQYAKACKYPSSRGVVQFMIDADASCDLFEHCKVDCLMEIMFLATLPEFRGKGIAKKLCEVSIEIARRLKCGENVKQPIDENSLELGLAPKIVSAIFTSFISQKIGRQLGFEIANDISYEKFVHEGKTFAERIGPQTPSTTLEYVKV